jgi:hypothetical protein
VSDAVRDSLAAGPLARDDFHQALRERLPDDLLWWCRGCNSRHVHPFTVARDRRPRRAGDRRARRSQRGVRRPARGRGGPGPRRGARAAVPPPYGRARPKLLADWAGIAPSHANALWERAGPLAAVELDGKPAWVLAEDAAGAADHPPASGARLLPNLDPLAAGGGRELLAPDPALRKRFWPAIGGPGLVLVGGELAGGAGRPSGAGSSSSPSSPSAA